MARPIERTPPIVGDDADLLLEQLQMIASPAEIARRREAARRHLAEVARPKGRSQNTPPAPNGSPEGLSH